MVRVDPSGWETCPFYAVCVRMGVRLLALQSSSVLTEICLGGRMLLLLVAHTRMYVWACVCGW